MAHGVKCNINYLLIPYSWGAGWGDKGFIKFARIGNMCGLSGFASYPVMRKIADEDDREYYHYYSLSPSHYCA